MEPRVGRRSLGSRLKAHQLAQIGNDLCRRGNSIWLALKDGSIVAAADWDISGEGVAPETWSYRLTLAGPSGNAVRVAGSDRVLHFRVGVNSRAPYKGRAPWANAPISAALAASLESVTDEKNWAARSDPYCRFQTSKPRPASLNNCPNWAGARCWPRLPNPVGRLAAAGLFLESGSHAALGQIHRTHSGRSGLTCRRAMLAAAGVPVELSAGGSGAGAREAWRRFLHSHDRAGRAPCRGRGWPRS